MFNLESTHPSWHPILKKALSQMDPSYLAALNTSQDWLPGPTALLNAFTVPMAELRFVLLGESPYPRAQSANGYAFWDAAVSQLWSESGLSRSVNRATSLRNFVKMLLVADGKLDQETGQAKIAALDKTALHQTADELFRQMTQHGFLLLNASLVLSHRPKQQDAKQWAPFIEIILNEIARQLPDCRFLIFGNFAKQLALPDQAPVITAEHPYNLSFIHNPIVLREFAPLRLLQKDPA